MFDPPKLTTLLSQVRHFQAMKPEERSEIIASGSIYHFPEGSVLFTEGEACAGMYVLLNGQIQLQKMGPEGKKQIVAVINPIIMFNEVPVLDGGPNVTTAIARRDCVVWLIPCDIFHKLLKKHPTMGLGLLNVLAARNRLLMEHYEDLSFRSVVGRTSKLLLDLSRDGKVDIDRQAHPNVELAARVAAGPEAFSRSLSMLRNKGYIQSTRETISIVETEALAELACVEIT